MDEERLAKPDPIPTRPDDCWRVVEEPNMVVVEPGGVCSSRTAKRGVTCNQEAVASTRRGDFLLCDEHLRGILVWVENGLVVSWKLVR
jgi:hypothetical protein